LKKNGKKRKRSGGKRKRSGKRKNGNTLNWG
jgi:hypothetical protein